jgi:two-component system LytT family response regulator
MSKVIRVLIVDDEPLARSGLRKLCEQDPELEVAGECADGLGAVAAIEQVEPDLVLLDIQMPGMDGFEVLRSIPAERMPQVVFVTAHDRFALRAFEVHALDYLLKPFGDRRFFDAMARAKQSLRRWNAGELRARMLSLLEEVAGEGSPGASGDSGDPASPFASRIVVRERGRVFLVRADEIDWIEAADYYAKLHVRDKVHLLRESLKSLAGRLDPSVFFRISRSAIVNLDRIREIQPYGRGALIVILEDGTRLTLSRSRKEALARQLGESL